MELCFRKKNTSKVKTSASQLLCNTICINYDHKKKFGLLKFHSVYRKLYLNSPKGYNSWKKINAQTGAVPSPRAACRGNYFEHAPIQRQGLAFKRHSSGDVALGSFKAPCARLGRTACALGWRCVNRWHLQCVLIIIQVIIKWIQVYVL